MKEQLRELGNVARVRLDNVGRGVKEVSDFLGPGGQIFLGAIGLSTVSIIYGVVGVSNYSKLVEVFPEHTKSEISHARDQLDVGEVTPDALRAAQNAIDNSNARREAYEREVAMHAEEVALANRFIKVGEVTPDDLIEAEKVTKDTETLMLRKKELGILPDSGGWEPIAVGVFGIVFTCFVTREVLASDGSTPMGGFH